MYSAAIKRNKVSSKPIPNASQQRTSNNNVSGTGMIVSVSSGGYKILCFVVSLAVITFVSSIWTLNHYSYSLNSSVKYSSLSSSRHSGIAEYMVTTFENIPTLFALQIAQLTTNITSKIVDFKTATTAAVIKYTLKQYQPTLKPVVNKTSIFSSTPSNDPASHSPSKNPTVNPSSRKPTHYPSSNVPTIEPTSNIPTSIPTLEPSSSLPTHTNIPTIEPTSNLPTHKPSTNIPTLKASSNMPTLETSSNAPTLDPSVKKLLLLAYHPQIPPSTLNNFTSLLSTERSTQIGRMIYTQNNISLQGSSFGTLANASAIGSSINGNQSSLSVFRTIEDNKLLVENVELLTSIDAYFLDSVATLDGSSKIGSLLPLELGPKNSSMREDPSRVLENVRGNVANDMRRCNESFPPLCPNNEEMYSYVRFWNQRFSKV